MVKDTQRVEQDTLKNDKSHRIAIVEDDSSFASFLQMTLEEEGYQVFVFHDPETALLYLPDLRPQVVLTDLKMPKMDGITLINRAKKLLPDSAFLVITAFGSIPSAVSAIKAGAVDYLSKPLSSPDEVLAKIKPYLRSIHGTKVLDDIPPLEIVFAGMEWLFEDIAEVASADVTVCLYGETGTGKSLIAKVIHRLSQRKGPFIEINCAALPENLIEAELFGYEKGAFTGAVRTKPGRVELANGGTLFLDEIAEISLGMQAKLLKLLQDRTFERLGGLQTLRTDARFIVATNKDLEKLIVEGKFREDLFYRLNVFSFKLPPLRERKAKLEKIVTYLLKKLSQKHGKPFKPLSKRSWDALKAYTFTGNLRELENLLERAVLLSKTEEIEIEVHWGSKVTLEVSREAEELQIKTLEKKAIIKALEVAKGNKPAAAKLLGISLKTLYNKLKEFNLRA